MIINVLLFAHQRLHFFAETAQRRSKRNGQMYLPRKFVLTSRKLFPRRSTRHVSIVSRRLVSAAILRSRLLIACSVVFTSILPLCSA